MNRVPDEISGFSPEDSVEYFKAGYNRFFNKDIKE